MLNESQVVVFELAKVKYGIDIVQVQEIIRMVEITPVSESDLTVEGIINLRGQVISVINLARRLNVTEKPRDNESRVIVVNSNDKKIGLVVDCVHEVGTYKDDELEEPSVIGTSQIIKGIVKKEKQLWLILNINDLGIYHKSK